MLEQEKDRNILVVDDNPDNLRLLAELLQERHYKVRLATTGERALATIRKEAPDLILLDVMMPEMDGFKICRQLKADEQTANIPIIFISALHETIDKVKAFTYGGVDYITKPFQAEEVLSRIKTHLSLSFLNRQLEKKNSELQKALDEIKILQGIISICANCKNVRDDMGYWGGVEIYISKHSEAKFSHSICPTCAKKLYPELTSSGQT
jgi:PleD family two-component response regulator